MTTVLMEGSHAIAEAAVQAGCRFYAGYPIKIADLLAQVDGTAYVARGAMHTPSAIAWTKRILREAFQCQLAGAGLSFVEILTMCPTDWYVEPTEAPAWVEQNFLGTYPLGVLKSL